MMEETQMAAVVVVGYLMCSVAAYGITFAYMQGNWPTLAESQRTLDRTFSAFIALFGPIGFIVSFVLSDFAKHGMKWR